MIRSGSNARSVALFNVLAGLALFAMPAPAAETTVPQKGVSVEGITEYRLPNGFRFLLFPDPSRPLVTVNMTVLVGSRHEGYGETGMAHLLEHMLFKGTPTHPNVPKALRDHGAGGRFNGTTWVDRTNYYETMPAGDENLEFGIRLEADRLVNSFVKREDLASEMTVVRNEFEMGENNPERILSQRMMAAAYEWHNYGKSTIGNRADIERVPIDSLKAFYHKYYRVDNAMLVIAGKFDEKKALALVAEYFGALKKPADPIPSTYTEEPAQDGERQVVLRRVGAVGATGAIYHVPAGPHPDFAAIEVLEDTLTASPSGRVYKALVEGKLASSVSGNVFAWHDPGVLEITAKVDVGDGTSAEKLVDTARLTLIDTIENLAKQPITEDEVKRSKVRFQTLHERLLSQTDRLAVQLSEWAAAGDWRLFFLHRDQVEKVTAADVNRVAAKYLTRNNRTVGVYYPEKEAQRAAIPATPDVTALVKDYKGRETVATGEAFDPTPENIEKRVTRGQVEGVKTAVLPKKTRGETVDLRLTLRFGNEKSLAGQVTAADLLGPLMQRGTKQHTRQQLTDELEKLGATLGVSSGAGSLNVHERHEAAHAPATDRRAGKARRHAGSLQRRRQPERVAARQEGQPARGAEAPGRGAARAVLPRVGAGAAQAREPRAAQPGPHGAPAPGRPGAAPPAGPLRALRRPLPADL
jgi:zinc protease